jgi:hypothetical protein
MDTFPVPILFLIFNRPTVTARVLARICDINPKKLYVACDGPRAGVEGEDAKVQETRQLVLDRVQGRIEVTTLFRDTNLGCKKAVSSAIDWFFENEPEGIILEDDCLPDPTFFTYCKALLERYRKEPRVGVISGDNFHPGGVDIEESYYFSIYPHVWGWASWRRTWRHYTQSQLRWEQDKSADMLSRHFKSRRAKAYWTHILDEVYAGRIDSWAYHLALSLWAEDLLTVLPKVNLVENIGFGGDATHTRSSSSRNFLQVKAKSLALPLSHPETIERHIEADERFEPMYLKNVPVFLRRLRARLKRFIS